MDKTIKDATVKRLHHDNHDHLTDFQEIYTFARRLKSLHAPTSYDYICKIWTSEPERFLLNPIHQIPGLNTLLSLTKGCGLERCTRDHGISVKNNFGPGRSKSASTRRPQQRRRA